MRSATTLWVGLALFCIPLLSKAQFPEIVEQDETEEYDDYLYNWNFDYHILCSAGGGYLFNINPIGIGTPSDLLAGDKYEIGHFAASAEYSFKAGRGLFVNLGLLGSSTHRGDENIFNNRLDAYLENYGIKSTEIVIPRTNNETDEPVNTNSNNSFTLNLGYQITHKEFALGVSAGGHIRQYYHFHSYSTVKLDNTNEFYFVDFISAEDLSTGYGYQVGGRLIYKPWSMAGFVLSATYFRSYHDYRFYEYETNIFTSQERVFSHDYNYIADWMSISLGYFFCL